MSGYPYLFAELMGHGWTVEELTKLAGGNLLRVFSEVSLCESFFVSLTRAESNWSAVFAPIRVVRLHSSDFYEIVNRLSNLSRFAFIVLIHMDISPPPLSRQVERVRDMKRMNNEKPYEDIPNFRLPLQTSDEQLYNCSNTV